jgi:hypothetical protein
MAKIVEYRIRKVNQRDDSYFSNEGYSKYYRRVSLYIQGKTKTIYGIQQARAHVKELRLKYPEDHFEIQRRVATTETVK